MTRYSYALAIVGLLLGMATMYGSSTAQPFVATASVPSHQPVSSQDRAWLAEMHQANLMDLQAGRLATDKGHSAAVRSAGHTIVTDHTRLDTDVSRVANKLKIELPKTTTPDQIDSLKRLARQSGTAFDHDFLTTMITGHKKLIANTEAETRTGSAPEITHLAKTALPGLHKHLSMLQTIAHTG